MSLNQNTKKIDIGRLIVLPIFSWFIVSIIIRVYANVKALEPVSTIKIATLIQSMLEVCFYALVVFLYIIRSSAKSTTTSLSAKTVAVVSTFLPTTIALWSETLNNSGIMLVANLVTMFGTVVSLYSLSALGRSFSIIPQARTLVQTGPYKFVRHPLYLGEFISLMGIVLARFSVSAIAIFCLIVALQTYRALQEEMLLVSIFREYESYSLRKARFIPGIF